LKKGEVEIPVSGPKGGERSQQSDNNKGCNDFKLSKEEGQSKIAIRSRRLVPGAQKIITWKRANWFKQ